MALFLLPVVHGSRNERGRVGLLIGASCVPAAVSARRPGLLSRGCCCLVGEAGLLVMQALLGTVGDLQDVVGLPFLTVG